MPRQKERVGATKNVPFRDVRKRFFKIGFDQSAAELFRSPKTEPHYLHGLKCKTPSFLVRIQTLHAPPELWNVKKLHSAFTEPVYRDLAKSSRDSQSKAKSSNEVKCDGTIDRSEFHQGQHVDDVGLRKRLCISEAVQLPTSKGRLRQ